MTGVNCPWYFGLIFVTTCMSTCLYVCTLHTCSENLSIIQIEKKSNLCRYNYKCKWGLCSSSKYVPVTTHYLHWTYVNTYTKAKLGVRERSYIST